jgi:3-oxoacyl-[acyl-carrier-protein] synthase II
MTRRRVVVTGLGCVSPVGNTVADAWANLIAGKSGIGLITKFDASSFNCKIAGEVKGFDVESYMSAKEARTMDTFVHYGIAAASQAIADAKLATGDALGEELANRIGCLIGSGIGGLPMIEDMHAELLNAGRVEFLHFLFRPPSSTWLRARWRFGLASKAPIWPSCRPALRDCTALGRPDA